TIAQMRCQTDVTTQWRNQTHQAFDQCRFACPVWACDGSQRARCKLPGNITHCDPATPAQTDLIQFNNRMRHVKTTPWPRLSSARETQPQAACATRASGWSAAWPSHGRHAAALQTK